MLQESHQIGGPDFTAVEGPVFSLSGPDPPIIRWTDMESFRAYGFACTSCLAKVIFKLRYHAFWCTTSHKHAL